MLLRKKILSLCSPLSSDVKNYPYGQQYIDLDDKTLATLYLLCPTCFFDGRNLQAQLYQIHIAPHIKACNFSSNFYSMIY